MLWIALAAAAAQLSAPDPKYMWLSNDDTPVKKLEGRGAVEVRLALTIGLDGRVHGCTVELSSGISDVDALTCDLARRRALFRPATSANGSTVLGVYRMPVFWATAPIVPKAHGDVAYRVSSLPKSERLPAMVRVMFAVDEFGHISGCAAEPPALKGQLSDNPSLVPIACDQLLSSYAAAPAKDETGKPVASVQDLTVELSPN